MVSFSMEPDGLILGALVSGFVAHYLGLVRTGAWVRNFGRLGYVVFDEMMGEMFANFC